MNTDTISRIKSLRREADTFATFHTHYDEKYRSDKHYDKKGYGFGHDHRITAFSIKTTFSSWAGTYGNSSVYPIMSVFDGNLVAPFIVKALNAHQKELFATVARLMREEAASLTGEAEGEIKALQAMLEDAKTALAGPVEERAADRTQGDA